MNRYNHDGSNLTDDYENDRPNYSRGSRPFDAGSYCFTSIISPFSEVVPAYSGTRGSVEFKMRRKNKTVTLQWEPFSGRIAANGISSIMVAQSICNLPPYPLTHPIQIRYKDVPRVTYVEIDPYSTLGNIRFYLNSDGSSTDTTIADAVVVGGGAISWIVN